MVYHLIDWSLIAAWKVRIVACGDPNYPWAAAGLTRAERTFRPKYLIFTRLGPQFLLNPAAQPYYDAGGAMVLYVYLLCVPLTGRKTPIGFFCTGSAAGCWCSRAGGSRATSTSPRSTTPGSKIISVQRRRSSLQDRWDFSSINPTFLVWRVSLRVSWLS